MERVLEKTAIARHDPLLSELRDPVSSESGGEGMLVQDPVGSWADHMECADGLAGLELAPSKGAHCTTVQLRNWKWTGPLLLRLRSRRGFQGFSYFLNR